MYIDITIISMNYIDNIYSFFCICNHIYNFTFSYRVDRLLFLNLVLDIHCQIHKD